MELQSLKQLILDENKPINERLKAIKLIKDSNLPDKAEFLESLSSNSNIQIRYFTKKILSETDVPVDSSKPVAKKEKSTVKTKAPVIKTKPVDKTPAKKTETSDNKIYDNRKFLIISGGIVCGILGIIIFIVFISVFLSSMNTPAVDIPVTKTIVIDEKHEQEKIDFENLIKKIRKEVTSKFKNQDFKKAYSKCRQLFFLLENNIKTIDYKYTIQTLEHLPWRFFNTHVKKAKKYDNKDLRMAFSLVYEIKSLIIKNRVRTIKIIDSLSYNVQSFVFLSSKTIILIENNLSSINSSTDKKILSSLIAAYKQNFLTADNIVSTLRLSKNLKTKMTSIIKNIEANNMHLPEAEVSVIKDPEFISKLDSSLSDDNLDHFENILEKRVGINRVSSSIKEIYYAFKNDLVKGKKILNFGIERTHQANRKNNLKFLLAKHYIAFNKSEEGMSILYALYYNNNNPETQEIYFNTIKKTLNKNIENN